MTLRERIADWLTGGDYSGALYSRDEWRKLAITGNERLQVWTERTFDRTFALRDIADMETEHANATVRRMAARAREALR